MIITAGCGISQQNWEKWPTWPKYCSMATDHINFGLPAAGNYLIGLSLLKGLQETTPAAVIVTWTSHNKLDIYVDNLTLAEEIQTYPTRNFLINWQGHTQKLGWWPSSVSDDNLIKQNYSKWANETSYALTTLQSVFMIQEYCVKNKIPLYQYMSYEWPLDDWKNNSEVSWLYSMINWEAFNLKILSQDYYNSKWRDYQVTNNFGLIPTAGWHAEFFINDILPVISKHVNVKNIKLDKLIEAATVLSRKIYDEDSNHLIKK